MRTRTIAVSLLPLACLAFGCADPALEPDANTAAEARSLLPRVEIRVNAAVYWNEIARGLVMKHASSPHAAARAYAILSIAQYNGAVAGAQPRRERALFIGTAITRASVDVLTYVYPTEAAALMAKADSFLARYRRPGDDSRDEAAGRAAGVAAAGGLIDRARTDGWFAVWNGTPPVGPGLWFSSTEPPTPPVLPLLGQARPFLLHQGDQFRPGPPPAFGSPAFAAAVAEVRRIADTRTAAQDSLAKFWALPAGTYTPFGYWNEEAATLALRYNLSDVETAHLLALVNMVGADAVITAHDAKYTHWLLRPSQADPGIRLAVGLPNFPSYISNHATISSGMARVLGTRFPAERRRLERLAEEAAMSRLYGGIHYRFDNEIGLEIGRRVADWALKHDVHTGDPFVLR